MKLTNLSLAIMVAVGVAACGGSGDDNSNKPADPPKNNNQGQNDDNKKPTPPAADPQVVDPTGTQVVDDKDLTKQNTVGTLQYVRRDGSQYDRVNNPSKPASASPLLGTTLNDQNPSLTNIVLARQETKREDGKPVKAQFSGMDNPIPLKLDGTANTDSLDSANAIDGGRSLQEENFANVDTLASYTPVAGGQIAGKHLNVDNIMRGTDANRTTMVRQGTVYKAVHQADSAPIGAVKGDRKGEVANVTALFEIPGEGKGIKGGKDGDTRNGAVSKVDIKGLPYFTYQTERTAGTTIYKTVTTADATESRLGKDLVWWSAPVTTYENSFTRGDAHHTDFSAFQAQDPDKATAEKFVRDGKAATSGLVRIGGGMDTLGEEQTFNKDTKKWEDHHKTTTRIFGRYHLATAISKDGKEFIKPVAMNTFTGAKSFTAEYKDGDSAKKATQYSIGAVPGTLHYVQYGRVSGNLDLDAGKEGYPDGFIRSRFGNKGDDATVDNYFYRGTNATTIEQMAALPSNQSAVYHGHALMYGIDNSFHGGGHRNLPNAFAGQTSGYGLGNFVEARVNFGTKRVVGEVYNEWLLDPTKAATTKDKLVRFQGSITGNTVVGTADRDYITGDDKATFKASFFGEKAEELGGSFNSVKDEDRYGDAYGQNDWGGVFGATKGGSGNTFQGDDGNNNYGQNNYDN